MKNKRWFALLLALCLLLPLSACALKPAKPLPEIFKTGGRVVRGSGNVTENKRLALEEGQDYALRITGVTLRNSNKAEIELVIDESLENELVITADDNINECIEVTNRAGSRNEITIGLEKRAILTPTKLVITLGVPLQALVLNGAWNFTYNCPGARDCEVDVNGACNGNLTFGALDALEIDVNGTGNITLAGTAKRADFEINGAGNIKAFELTAENADVTINGTGNCEVTATKTLRAEINGVGKVVYDGAPDVEKSIHGLGEVKVR